MENKLPVGLLEALHAAEGFDEKSFAEVHESGNQVVSVRMNPAKSHDAIFDYAEKVPWSRYGYYLPSRPSFILDPLLHAGVYYVQEASGMFIEQCLAQHCDLNTTLRVLDLCAAPGGKSTLIQSLIHEDSVLVSNEVIKSRVGILTENLSKWGGANVIVTNNDPSDFSRLENFFDVMVVDAPCSGSGLFRKDPGAISEWSEELVAMCSQRQKRILTAAYASLKQGGLLVYSTCSYSVEEDEDIADWLMTTFDLESLHVQIHDDWNIVESHSTNHAAAGYRFFPDKVKGEGLYVACFRKNDGGDRFKALKKSKPSSLPNKEASLIHPWLRQPGKVQLYDAGAAVFAFPVRLAEELAAVQSALYIKKAGVAVGKLMRQELVPAHELAISTLVNKNFNNFSLKRNDALQYLRKEEVTIDTDKKGWAVVSYNGHNLGWIKLLGNRINNYYPKEWRILKSENN